MEVVKEDIKDMEDVKEDKDIKAEADNSDIEKSDKERKREEREERKRYPYRHPSTCARRKYGVMTIVGLVCLVLTLITDIGFRWLKSGTQH